MASSNTKVSLRLKILIDTKGQRILFAEAGKDFVDFLFTLLSLPIGSVVGLLLSNSTGMAGSLGKLYKSIEPSHELAAEKIYGCHNSRGSSCTNYVSDDPRAICPQCGGKISRERIIVSHSEPEGEFSSADEGGYVKGVVTYMVMDDLEVKPMSTISSLTMLRTFNVKDIADLEEKMISIGMDEGLKLLKASFQSKTVLTDVFLRMKAT
ncbi:hypothetical protein FEM48_Zijuj03G0075900 [Ziziphus jujuba var. spinosa]|uniref:DUF674 domain-containing protein n=1 Tax=Ziziphus jujuba var. spinosa TaxID=714518 RepID=A0A978VP04_ZIZJJ|nr:uncharacterized protein LOC107420721 [Ziziphus jujuba var. spinosa]KAH7537279.1 hypothetical protein FEM48_Zijuj03G0075900 [Ziziphus jujuba var. spinosa]